MSWYHPWIASPRFYRKAGQSSHDEQASNSTLQGLGIKPNFQVPALFEFLPLTFFNDELECGSVSQINHFLPNFLLHMVFSSQPL